jgi:hypothetical protein
MAVNDLDQHALTAALSGCQWRTRDWQNQQRWMSRCRRNFGNIVPCAEGGIASRAILVGIEVITAELEMVVDPTVGGEKALRMTR